MSSKRREELMTSVREIIHDKYTKRAMNAEEKFERLAQAVWELLVELDN